MCPAASATARLPAATRTFEGIRLADATVRAGIHPSLHAYSSSSSSSSLPDRPEPASRESRSDETPGASFFPAGGDTMRISGSELDATMTSLRPSPFRSKNTGLGACASLARCDIGSASKSSSPNASPGTCHARWNETTPSFWREKYTPSNARSITPRSRFASILSPVGKPSSPRTGACRDLFCAKRWKPA